MNEEQRLQRLIIEEDDKETMEKMKERIMKLKRDSEYNLLTDFINFLNKSYYNIGYNEVMEKQINKFLDERK